MIVHILPSCPFERLLSISNKLSNTTFPLLNTTHSWNGMILQLLANDDDHTSTHCRDVIPSEHKYDFTIMDIEVKCNLEAQTISLSQKSYITFILARFNFSDCSSMPDHAGGHRGYATHFLSRGHRIAHVRSGRQSSRYHGCSLNLVVIPRESGVSTLGGSEESN